MKVAIIATSPLQIMLSKKICEKYYQGAYIECHVVNPKKDARLEKIIALADMYEYKTKVHYTGSLSFKNIMKYIYAASTLFHHNSFDIVIIGWYKCMLSHVIALSLLKNNGEILYTDDGTATFELEDAYLQKQIFSRKGWLISDSIMTARKIIKKKYYTIFANINNARYEFHNLSLNQQCNGEPKGIFVLGTNPDVYRNMLNPIMSKSDYENFMDRFFEYIKQNYPNDILYFSPHGRDDSEFNKVLCEKYNFKYIPSRISVEVDYVNNNFYPKIIYGLSSTALFTLKRIFTNSNVTNVMPKNFSFKFNDYEKTIVDNYASEGIKTIEF